MELMAAATVPVAWCRKGTVAFLVTQQMTTEILQAARTSTLDDTALKRLLQRALHRFPDRPQRATLARAILGVSDNPGVRVPFKLDGSAINQERIRAVLQGRA